MTNIIKTIAASFLILVLAGSAQATLVNFTLTGEIDTVSTGNLSGLIVGDMITTSGVFDDLALTNGTGLIDFAYAGNDMIISVGSVTYTNAMEVYGGAYMYLSAGEFNGLDYSATAGDFDSFNFDFLRTDQFTGTWDAASFSMSAVPVPAAVWLFASGFLTLIGVSRRQQS